MANLILNGSTSGSVTLSSPAVSGTTTLTLPTTSGTVITTASTFAGTGPAFYATQSVAVTPSSNTRTKITINTVSFDTNSNFNTTTNRFTPTVAGYYQFNGSAFAEGATATNLSEVTIFKNGSLSIDGVIFYNAVATYSTMKCIVSGVIYMNGTTDYVELYGRTIGTGTLSLNSGVFNGVLVRSA